MRRIYKYPVEGKDRFVINMPKGAQVLSMRLQRNGPQIWALVDPTADGEDRHFRLAGTGHDIKEDPESLTYIDTCLLYGGDLVLHLFEYDPTFRIEQLR